MNELTIKNSDGDRARYRELLLRRDELKKEAFFWDREYIRVFGDMLLRNFRQKLSCIRKKKAISFCQKNRNRGLGIDENELQAYLNAEMAGYETELKQMVRKHELSNSGSPLSETDALEVKKLYRKLAKRLHPDMNPGLAGLPGERDLWERIVLAYKCNDLEALRELQILAEAFGNEEEPETEIPDLAEKIEQTEQEISRIQSTEPYRYRDLISDTERTKKKIASLEEEYSSFLEYEKELDRIMEELMAGGMTLTWTMN